MNEHSSLTADWLTNESVTSISAELFTAWAVPTDLVNISDEALRDFALKTDFPEYTLSELEYPIARLRSFLLDSRRDEIRAAQPILPINDISISLQFSLRLARMVHDENARDWALEYVSNAAADGNLFAEAVDIALEISSITMRGRALGRIGGSQAQRKDLTSARHTAAIIEDNNERAEALCRIMEAYRNYPWTSLLDETLWDALDATRDIDFELFRASRLREIALILVDRGRLQEARDTAEEIIHAVEGLVEGQDRERWAVQPLTKAAVILSATGDYAAAEYQLERALAVARADDDGYFIAEGVQAVIKSWLAIGSIDHAVRIANDFSWNYDRACALQIIVRHCCDGGDTSRARSLIDAIDLPDLRAEALRHLAEYQATRNERGSVVAILASMNDVGLADQVLTSVVRGAAAGQQFEWAIQLSSKIQDPASAAEALLMVGHRKVDLGNPVGDEFDAAEAKISEVPDPKERSRLFWNLEQLNARIAPGPAMLERMNRLWWGVAGRDDGLKVIAETLGRRGFVMEALEAADRIASGYDSSRERGLALAYLARGVATRSVRA